MSGNYLLFIINEIYNISIRGINMVFKELIEATTDNFISLAMTAAVIYMVVTQITVPEWLIAAYGMILAFYFKA
jgi:hypothetical protein